MLNAKEYFAELMELGLVYRYQTDRFNALKGGGQPFLSPIRRVKTGNGEMIEELIQPICKPIVITKEEHCQLTRLADAWQRFLQVQLNIYWLAKQRELAPELQDLVRLTCTDLEWEKGGTQPGYDLVFPFMRLDAVKTEQGFKVIDINSTRPAGVGDLIAISKGYQEFLGIPANPYPTAALFVQAVEQCSNQWKKEFGAKTNCRGIILREDAGDWHNFLILAKTLNEAGFETELVCESDLNNKLNQLQTVIRSRIKEGDPLYSVLGDGYPARCCIVSPLHRRFLGNKLWMYFIRLPEIRQFFLEQMGNDYNLIEQSFPKAGIIQNGQVVFPEEEQVPVTDLKRKEWTIKQPGSSSGKQAVLGLTMGQANWQELLSQDHSGWLVQQFFHAMELVPVLNQQAEVVEEKLFIKYGIFFLGGRLAGLEYHARRYPVVHGARNTYFTCAWHE